MTSALLRPVVKTGGIPRDTSDRLGFTRIRSSPPLYKVRGIEKAASGVKDPRGLPAVFRIRFIILAGNYINRRDDNFSGFFANTRVPDTVPDSVKHSMLNLNQCKIVSFCV